VSSCADGGRHLDYYAAMKPIVSKKIRNAARLEECTVRAVGHCDYNPETTVLAHLPDESKGMSKKADDISGCFACVACHRLLDGVVWDADFEESRDFYMRRISIELFGNASDDLGASLSKAVTAFDPDNRPALACKELVPDRVFVFVVRFSVALNSQQLVWISKVSKVFSNRELRAKWQVERLDINPYLEFDLSED